MPKPSDINTCKLCMIDRHDFMVRTLVKPGDMVISHHRHARFPPRDYPDASQASQIQFQGSCVSPVHTIWYWINVSNHKDSQLWVKLWLCHTGTGNYHICIPLILRSTGWLPIRLTWFSNSKSVTVRVHCRSAGWIQGPELSSGAFQVLSKP
jgi:hypothetical protein